ncbi:aldehyde dehydrogenase family protein [Corynebacterium canis]|uniref:L-glutamate gamma-semialdehyde dehydrogenase n=1 Tax=Corynebacterium canis TaxID=679663 RepID=A0A5C5UIN6_9CORY|nr:bifunctional proline dehydrogenase/L-glutamate gamma-semialdehyde dehydrogenase [Corynebacterium canis]TWT26581.1 aldehyde dehydrogenase family protein [Corynebacterium canis]WJY76359.1 1-pyrroline-5-carboxylate dehydrogenase [Corynebacterium canis]
MTYVNRDLEKLQEKIVTRANEWLAAEKNAARNKSTEQLAAMVHDPSGVEFTMRFVDRVARPQCNDVAARELAKLTDDKLPDFIGPIDRTLVSTGAKMAKFLPNVIMPAARTRLRQMVSHLVLDAEGKALNKLLDESRAKGYRLNVNLLGEAVLGDGEANNRLRRTMELLKNPRVDYVSIKATSVVAQLNPWDIDGNTELLKDRLRPLYRLAMQRDPHPFINLDMEEYKDLHVTIRLFEELLMEEEFLGLEAGIVLQAYLPDSFPALQRLAEFAKRRAEAGGAKIKIRLVKGANLSMEKVDAELHGWYPAPYATKEDVDANYLRMMDYILRPEHENVRVGIASHNLFSVASAYELSVERGVEAQLDVEMLQGMAPAQAEAVRQAVGTVILYTPVVHAEDFDVAVSYLVRRLEENGAPENFLYALFGGDLSEQEQRFRESVARRWEVSEDSRRLTTPSTFNASDSDPALLSTLEWARELSDPQPEWKLVTDVDVVDAAVEKLLASPRLDVAERTALLERAADELENMRQELLGVMTHEAGKTVAEADPEVSEAIDFARYYAKCAQALNTPGYSTFTPHNLVVVASPWNFPVAIPLGGVFASIAAGAKVVLKPAPEVRRCAEVAMKALRKAGIGEDLAELMHTDEADAGRRLMSHPDVDAIILTGASETASLFRGWKPEMNIHAETSGKNAIIVTPSADPDLAVADVYKSAFGHAGQKCSAASLVILVGDVGRFTDQLIDATRTLRVGHGYELSTTMNGLISPPGDKLLRGLTKLESGETWLVKPEKLNEEGTLWSPGIRDNVRPGSWFHTHECFGPVLGIMHASTLEEAIEWQNSTGFGLTGGIHSLDEDEVALWREKVEVGNAYINRGITGAIVQRQPFGGWKNSSVGVGAKAGGPNYVAQLGTWADVDSDIPSVSLTPAYRELANTDFLRRAAALDELAWRTEFGVEQDFTGLRCESNVFRYRPLETLYVVGDDEEQFARLQLAALRTGTELRRLETHEWFPPHSRIRAIGDGPVPATIYEWAALNGSVVIDTPVLADGRRELLHFLKEQAVSTTKHRFGYIKSEDK